MSKPTIDDLIRAILLHVPFDGWSATAIANGAADIGIEPAEAALMFPNGAIDAVEAFTDLADREMAAGLDRMEQRPERISVIIREAILCRLDWATPHREAVNAALKKVRAGQFTAEDYGALSHMKVGGSTLAPLGTFEKKLPAELIAKVRAKEKAILAGSFTVKVNDAEPKSTP